MAKWALIMVIILQPHLIAYLCTSLSLSHPHQACLLRMFSIRLIRRLSSVCSTNSYQWAELQQTLICIEQLVQQQQQQLTSKTRNVSDASWSLAGVDFIVIVVMLQIKDMFIIVDVHMRARQCLNVADNHFILTWNDVVGRRSGERAVK